MNGNHPIPHHLWQNHVIAGGQITPPTTDDGDQVLSVKLDPVWGRPWRITVVVNGPTQAYDKAGQPLGPLTNPPAVPYAQTRRARLQWRFSQQMDPIVTDLPAAGGVYTVSAHDLTVSVVDPGPDIGMVPAPKYRFALEEAPIAPTTWSIEAMPRFTQDLVAALGFGSAAIWVTPRRARAMWVYTNSLNGGIYAMGPYAVTFYDGQSRVVGYYEVTAAAGRLGGDAATPILVPSATATYAVKNTGFAGAWQLPTAQFAIDL